MDVITPIGKFVVGLVKPHFDYVIDHDDNVKGLEVRLNELDRTKQRVQHKVDDASSKSQKIEADVAEWLKRVEGIAEQAGKLLEAERHAQMCFYGLCPNFIALYNPSKKASSLAQLMVVEVEQGKGLIPSVAYTVPLRATPTTPEGFQAFASRTSIVTQILEEFQKENIDKIGVFGMAGVGKSTFVKQVTIQAKEKLFDIVGEAEVKEKPDVKSIQNRLALSFGLKLDTTQTIDERQLVLSNYIKDKKKKILIILDDIWEKLDLNTLGLEVGYCKILLTSRDGGLLHSEMRTQKNFPLDVLEEDEAWSLFEKKVRDDVKHPDIEEVATQIVKRCGGLPILVEQIAETLKGKPIHSWNDTLTRLNRSDGKRLLEKVYSEIECSYNQLDDEDVKSLFLISGMLWDQCFHLYDLLKYTMGLSLKLFEGIETMEQAYYRLQSSVDKLRECCLLRDTDRSQIFMMHDLTRDVARNIASRDQHFLSFGYEKFKEWPSKELLQKCVMMSINRINIPKLPEELECQGLHLFTFESIDKSLQIPPKFFRKMKSVKVLDLTNLCIPSLPPSIQSLTSLQTLCLDQCELRDITIIGELRTLEILSFAYSMLKQLPKEIGNLTRLRLLDLSYCPELEVIYPDVIKSLTRLEELNMNNNFNKWATEEASNDINERSNARLSELKHLPNLTTLGINIKDANQLPFNFFSGKLNYFKILIGDVWEWQAEYEISKTLKLKLSERNQWDKSLQAILKRCEDLSLDVFEGVNNLVYQLDMDGFQRLKKLHVQNNPEILHIMNSSMYDYSWIRSHAAFPILEELSLHNLVSLENVCSGQLAVDSFRQLKVIKVQSCPKMKNIFSLSTISHFLQLEEIEVKDCNNMKEIIVGEKEKQLEIEASNPIKFHGLQSLSLRGLPELTCFASNPNLHETSTSCDHPQLFNDMVVFPQLENLNLSSIPLNKLWDGHFSARMSWIQNLTCLIVDGCDGLSFLCSSSMAINFVQLRNLEINRCQNMVEIISTEEKMENIFPNLESLHLEGLAKLENFCTSSSYIEFPCLQWFHIEDCTKLGSFVLDPTSKDIRDCAGHYLFDKKAGFPSLETLEIIGLHKLTTIWHSQLAPDSFCKLTDLWVQFCPSLIHILVPGILERLHSLKKLTVSHCKSVEAVFNVEGMSGCDHHDPSEIFTCRNLVNVYIEGCNSMENVFPAPVARVLEKLDKLWVSQCKILKQIVAKEEVGLKKVMPKFLFPNVSFFQLWELRQLSSFYPGMHTSKWPSLKQLHVVGCNKLKILAQDCSSFQQQQHDDRLRISTKLPFFLFEKGSFSDLEELYLKSKYSLCDSELPLAFFKVKNLSVGEFSITSAALSVFLKKFHNLRVLEVETGTVEEIFNHEGVMDEKEHVFAQLKSLKLKNMHNLVHICKENSHLAIPVVPNLEILQLEKCGRLKNIVSSSISFGNLVQLKVVGCHGLVHLITHSIAESLVQLESIRVKNCKKMTEIVGSSDDHGNEDIDDADHGNEITFSRLKELKLSKLPKLKGFCSRNYIVKFPFLTTLLVTSCLEMKVSVDGILLNDSKRGVILQTTEEDEDEDEEEDEYDEDEDEDAEYEFKYEYYETEDEEDNEDEENDNEEQDNDEDDQDEENDDEEQDNDEEDDENDDAEYEYEVEDEEDDEDEENHDEEQDNDEDDNNVCGQRFLQRDAE